MRLCRELGVLYIDTVVEPWAGHLFRPVARPGGPHQLRAARGGAGGEAAHPGGPTAVSCCGANPGMVSWLLKEALLRLAADTGRPAEAPREREGWARLMQRLGVKGVHIAERDTQAGRDAKPIGSFVNTWSVEGFISGELPAGRARLGHATSAGFRRTATGTRAVAGRRSISTRRGS